MLPGSGEELDRELELEPARLPQLRSLKQSLNRAVNFGVIEAPAGDREFQPGDLTGPGGQCAQGFSELARPDRKLQFRRGLRRFRRRIRRYRRDYSNLGGHKAAIGFLVADCTFYRHLSALFQLAFDDGLRADSHRLAALGTSRRGRTWRPRPARSGRGLAACRAFRGPPLARLHRPG